MQTDASNASLNRCGTFEVVKLTHSLARNILGNVTAVPRFLIRYPVADRPSEPAGPERGRTSGSSSTPSPNIDAADRQTRPETLPRADHTAERTPNVVPLRIARIVAGRRLFYVALTRAKRRCTVFFRQLNPSPFVLELMDQRYAPMVTYHASALPQRCLKYALHAGRAIWCLDPGNGDGFWDAPVSRSMTVATKFACLDSKA